MVVLLKPESKSVMQETTSETHSEPLVIRCEGDSEYDVQNVIDNIIVVERIKKKLPRDVVEKAVQILAMLLCVLSALSSFANVTFLAKRIYFTINVNFLTLEPEIRNRVWISLLLMTGTYCIVGYVFSIILLKGLKRRKSALLLTYFVYGVVNITFAFVLMIAINIIKDSKILASLNVNKSASFAFTLLYLSCLMIYSTFLYAVWSLYDKYVKKELREAEAKRMEPYTLPLRFPKPSRTETILTGFATVVGVGILLNFILNFILGRGDNGTLLTDLLLMGVAAGTTIIALASFAFGMALTRGILTKRPVLILAYFIYGVIVLVICVITSLLLGVTSYKFAEHASDNSLDVYAICAIIMAAASVTYSPILWMIWEAYRRIRNHNQYFKQTTTL